MTGVYKWNFIYDYCVFPSFFDRSGGKDNMVGYHYSKTFGESPYDSSAQKILQQLLLRQSWKNKHWHIFFFYYNLLLAHQKNIKVKGSVQLNHKKIFRWIWQYFEISFGRKQFRVTFFSRRWQNKYKYKLSLQTPLNNYWPSFLKKNFPRGLNC